MKIMKGNLWDWHAKGWKIVISTNIGWQTERHRWAGDDNGPVRPVNNMGAGIALQAMQRWPWLPEWLGSQYRARHMAGLPQLPLEHDALRLIFVPVKPLLVGDPGMSWNQKGSPELISEQLHALAMHRGEIAIGFVGCGNGSLKQSEVLPALLRMAQRRRLLRTGETVLVDREQLSDELLQQASEAHQ